MGNHTRIGVEAVRTAYRGVSDISAIFRTIYILYNELNPLKGEFMNPYDQKSLEAGIDIGVGIGIFLSLTSVSAVWLTKKTVKWFKEEFKEK
jgi:hypothetical protein